MGLGPGGRKREQRLKIKGGDSANTPEFSFSLPQGGLKDVVCGLIGNGENNSRSEANGASRAQRRDRLRAKTPRCPGAKMPRFTSR